MIRQIIFCDTQRRESVAGPVPAAECVDVEAVRAALASVKFLDPSIINSPDEADQYRREFEEALSAARLEEGCIPNELVMKKADGSLVLAAGVLVFAMTHEGTPYYYLCKPAAAQQYYRFSEAAFECKEELRLSESISWDEFLADERWKLDPK